MLRVATLNVLQRQLTIDKGFAVENVEWARAKNGLLYPPNPMAMLVENANGRAVANQESVLDLTPSELHQRVPILLVI